MIPPGNDHDLVRFPRRIALVEPFHGIAGIGAPEPLQWIADPRGPHFEAAKRWRDRLELRHPTGTQDGQRRRDQFTAPLPEHRFRIDGEFPQFRPLDLGIQFASYRTPGQVAFEDQIVAGGGKQR